MKTNFIKECYQSLLDEIEKIQSGEVSSPLKCFSDIMALINNAIKEVRSFVTQHGFENEQQEIEFFKFLKPSFVALYIYKNEDYHISQAKPVNTLKVEIAYYQSELEIIQRHFDQNHLLYTYYKSGEEFHDRQYFLRKNNTLFDIAFGIADREFSTQKDYAFAKFMALEMLRDKLIRKIQLIELEVQAPLLKNIPRTQLIWTDPKVNLVELAYGIFLKGSINHGDVKLYDLIFWLESTLNVSLDDFNRKFVDITRRKVQNPATYLGSMTAAVEDFIADPLQKRLIRPKKK